MNHALKSTGLLVILKIINNLSRLWKISCQESQEYLIWCRFRDKPTYFFSIVTAFFASLNSSKNNHIKKFREQKEKTFKNMSFVHLCLHVYHISCCNKYLKSRDHIFMMPTIWFQFEWIECRFIHDNRKKCHKCMFLQLFLINGYSKWLQNTQMYYYTEIC